jgi:hypothetical protein
VFNLIFDRHVHRAKRAGAGEVNHGAFCAEWGTVRHFIAYGPTHRQPHMSDHKSGPKFASGQFYTVSENVPVRPGISAARRFS